ncbi:SymE family type I addiction module toxin [Pectobacterium parmentieri]|uniref:SymE family type I addiction module toxin n=1 Tax=Pectobacterium parmentieri TaxID=1905730 RepID=UPI0018E1A149|nr:SymE family type I addiction module toxin [Pectobacterium parmentieri]QQA75782.1 type I toxin-antitoxin system SymE family toxin [Pectobacterium parmentieri]
MHYPRSAGLSDVNKTSKIEHYYTVGYAPHNGKSNPLSAINLKGRWLKECGFITGMPVTVTVDLGRIIIETQINL